MIIRLIKPEDPLKYFKTLEIVFNALFHEFLKPPFILSCVFSFKDPEMLMSDEPAFKQFSNCSSVASPLV